MTSRLLMPLRPAGAGAAPAAEAVGSTRPTAILDWRSPEVTAFVARVRRAADEAGARTARARLQTAHRMISAEVRPVYSVADLRRASRTLRSGRGSCSQRMAVLEAVARATDVPTRVRGLLVDGSFWYPRFPSLRLFVPERVLLAWPEFRLDDAWVPVAELFGDLDALRASGGEGFANSGPETLFEAVARTAVDWDGPGACAAAGPCDLSAHVRTDLGRFSSRDELFAAHGQTLCLPARTLAEPILGRWNADAARAA